MIKIAKEFKGQVNFAVSSKQQFSSEIQALGLDEEAEVVAGLYDSKGKYSMAEKFR